MPTNRPNPQLEAARAAFHSGDHRQAGALCGALLKSGHKKNPEVLQMAALSAQALGDLPAGMRLQGKAVKLAPRDPVLRINLAGMQVGLGLRDKALAELAAAEAVGAERADILEGLARAYHAVDAPFNETRHHSIAVEGFIRNAEKLLAVAPEALEVRFQLGRMLCLMGRGEAAERHLVTALEQTSGAADIRKQLIQVLIADGRFEEAEGQCRALLATRAEAPSAYLSLSNIRADALTEEDRDRIGQLLAAPSLSGSERAALHHALARALDHDGEYDAAFEHFQAANQAEAATAWGDLETLLGKLEEIVGGFTPERLAAEPAERPARPIFVVGMPRSGTTLVEQILAAHPDAEGAGELGDITLMVQEFEQRSRYPRGVAVLDRAGRERLRARYEAALDFHCPGAARVVDKMPRNFMHLGLIHLLYPDAVILHCRRAPMATCFSNFVTNFSAPTVTDGDLVSIGRFYRGYAAMMERWKALLPEGRLVEVVYEDLIADPEGQTRRLLDLCGLDWEPACLDFHRQKRSVRTASAAQVRRPISGDKREYWRRYESHLGPLIEALGDLAG